MAYSPTLGRWMQQDPVGYMDGANSYQVVMDSPVNYVDPLGLETKVIINPGGGKTRVHDEGWTTVWDKEANLIKKYPNDCTILIELDHFGQHKQDKRRWSANPNCKQSAWGVASCFGDYHNRISDGPNDFGLKPGVISGLPRMTAPIGPGRWFPLMDAQIQMQYGDAYEAFGLNNQREKYNLGHGVGPAAFKKAMDDIYNAALADAKRMLEMEDNCGCKEIRVRLLKPKKFADQKLFTDHVGMWHEYDRVVTADD